MKRFYQIGINIVEDNAVSPYLTLSFAPGVSEAEVIALYQKILNEGENLYQTVLYETNGNEFWQINVKELIERYKKLELSV